MNHKLSGKPGAVYNLLAHAPKHLQDELTENCRDMIYANAAAEVEKRRKAFLRKWRLKCRAVPDSLEEAGARLFTFTRLDPSQWKSARTTNAIERLNEEVCRRIKTRTVLPCEPPRVCRRRFGLSPTLPRRVSPVRRSSLLRPRRVGCFRSA